MNSQSYGEFSQHLHRRVGGAHHPISATVEVTRRCPLDCAHCYNNLPIGDRVARAREFTLAEHQHLLDQMADAGTLFLLYTGGEIFARRDFLDIFTYAKQKGFLITLFTNGTLLTPAIVDQLAIWRPFAIEITLYGRTRETYEALTGAPGSHERCLRGIDLLLERGLPLALKTVATSLNVHEIPAMKQFAAELGVPFKFDAMMNPRIDCSQSPLQVRLSPAEIVQLDLGDAARLDEWRDLGKRAIASPSAKDTEHIYNCGGGINAFAVDPDGKMSICVLSHCDTYDLRSGTLQEGWKEFLRHVRAKKTTQLTKCTHCALKSICGMCPANAELENGDSEKPVDFLCQVAHLRSYAFGFDVPAHGPCEYCPDGTEYRALTGELNLARDSERPRRKHLTLIHDRTPGGCGSCTAGQ